MLKPSPNQFDRSKSFYSLVVNYVVQLMGFKEMALRAVTKAREAREPFDGKLIRPGWVREQDCREEELRGTLDWVTDVATCHQ